MIKLPDEVDLENFTLILPSVAVGNVGQFCADLLIFNLNMSKIGSVWSPKFLPVCGLDPYDKNSSSLCTTADFYIATVPQLIVLQIRSPSIGKSTDFFDELTQFVQQRKIKKVIILTSSYDYERSDRSGSSFRYLTSDASLLNDEKLLEMLDWKKHVGKNLAESAANNFIPGGGFANNLYDYLTSAEIPCTVLFCYCSEGDNITDALAMMKNLNQWLNLIETSKNDVKYPISWEYFYGNPPVSEIY